MKLDLSIFLIQSKSFQVYFVLDIFIALLAGDGTIGFFYAIFHCPFDNVIQRNYNNNRRSCAYA